MAVLTGVYFGAAEQLGAACIDVATGKIEYAMAKKIPGAYHGTGDVFASAFTASLLRGKSPQSALQTAAGFTSRSIERTRQAGTDVRYGVNFEAGLGELAGE
jgi:pyridoxine kinase